MNSSQEKLSQAIQFHNADMLQEAGELYGQILHSEPNNAEVLHLFGILMNQIGDFDTAVSVILKAVELNPQDSYYCSLGNVCFDKGDEDAAINCYLKTIELNPRNLDAYNNLGMVYTAKEMFDDAIACYQKALEINSGYPEIYNNLGSVFFEINEIEQSIKCYEKAIELNPNYTQAYFNIGNAYKGNDNFVRKIDNPEHLDKAVSYYQKAIELMPDFAAVYINLGKVYFYKGDTDKELNCYQKALELKPDSAQIYNNIGNIYKDKGLIKEAIPYFEKSIELNPNSVDVYSNLAISYLALQDFEKGWHNYQWRLHDSQVYKARISGIKQPLWDGSSLDGKTIYVYYEQGFGDTVNFVRYLPVLHSMGAKVLFKPQKELEKLLHQSDIKAEIIDNSTPDESLTFDTHIPLMSIPYLLKANAENIPLSDKYLKADPEKVKFYKENYFNNDSFKLGINWQCRNFDHVDVFRSIPHLSYFYPLARLDGVKIYSFQKGCGTDHLVDIPEGIEVVNLGDTFDDFSDTAAALENLDLLISVDTSVPHVAGALGIPTWILLQYVPDWRWFQASNNTPWYDSVKLFRQKQINNWQEVVDEVYSKLQKHI